ncbi:PDZ domain-containing protein, partial [Oryctes borbonicus]
VTTVKRKIKPKYHAIHVNKTTTYESPIVRNLEPVKAPEPRTITLERSPALGFGFVAGSEKPVIVRFVTEGGPSVEKLLPGDQIWQVNGEDVKVAPREHVIQLVRACSTTVTLTVCQPAEQQGARKSTLLSASKRARLKTKPSRVRFAESVCVNGAPLFPVGFFLFSFSILRSSRCLMDLYDITFTAVGFLVGRSMRASDGECS